MTVLFCANGARNQFGYTPSLGAAIVFIIVFSILSSAHVIRMIRSKQWFMAAFIVGGLLEVSGFIIRTICHNDPCVHVTYIIQLILILVAPSIFAATIYMILGRTIRAVRAERLSLIRVKLLTKVFVAGDLACFFSQLTGAAIMGGGGKSAINLGRTIILVGLSLQIVLFGLFVLVAVLFHYRIRKSPTPLSRRPQIRWLTMLNVLYGVSILIMVRNIFRVVEYAGGKEGYLLSHEWPLYIFDIIFMTTVMVVLLWYFPTLIRPKEVFPLDNMDSEGMVADNRSTRYKHVSAQSPNPSPDPSPFRDSRH